ncbi:MAG TPA: Gfo/Idh/MocA family oxidoreductase, partial [Longimicrobiales bacterium]|nr:Gfo/Idh/MocA family oxidoreductase [Longimicrobiales bacterium]
KKLVDDAKRDAIMAELGISDGAPSFIREAVSRPPGDRIRIGIIGFGGEGESLVRSAGFAHPDWLEREQRAAEENFRNRGYQTFMEQADLNIELTGVCDVYDLRARRGLDASASRVGPTAGHATATATRYLRYTDMLESHEVDAVLIATPDHWHAQMCIDAAAAGKHIYVEKAMTRTEEETHRMYDAVKASGVVFQLGHQQRQTESHIKAREVVDAGILGPVNLVEVTTNRNDPWGAWVWGIPEEGTPETIDWEQFQGPTENRHPFSPERFFRWRCWYDYGTGLAGDLFSHEYDAINQILGMGIPATAVASGGIYFFKDGRDVPDVWQATLEYPDRDLTLLYSATLSNGRWRGRVFMGHDATMEVDNGLSITADGSSTRYRTKIDEGIIDTARPMFTYQPGFSGVDAITSATAEYFASRGLLYTYREGRLVNSYHLHIKEWLDVIRHGGETSCNLDRGFEEAISCHMATRAYREGRQVRWDPVARRIV